MYVDPQLSRGLLGLFNIRGKRLYWSSWQNNPASDHPYFCPCDILCFAACINMGANSGTILTSELWKRRRGVPTKVKKCVQNGIVSRRGGRSSIFCFLTQHTCRLSGRKKAKQWLSSIIVGYSDPLGTAKRNNNTLTQTRNRCMSFIFCAKNNLKL